MIPKGKCFDPLTNSLNQFFKKSMEASVEKLYADLGYKYSVIAVSVDTNGSLSCPTSNFACLWCTIQKDIRYLF